MHQLLSDIDDWCVKRQAALRKQMDPYIMGGGNLDDPQYRVQLGEHRAYMAMRSYIHGTLKNDNRIIGTSGEQS